jgi:putative phosphoesterase
MRLGVISDTHGLLRPEALRALRGVQLIAHAGDVGDPQILAQLKVIAPVIAVRGNVDTEQWARELPASMVIEANGASLYILHNLQHLDVKPESSGFHAVISGHTHEPKQFEKNGVLYLNPGSAGPRRFHLPVTLATLDLTRKPLRAEIVMLLPA